ncbi:response regulator transcription factor [Mucilaginibacter sp. X4EP1]|uniref:helix-turn-helix transcriptional regulator n=1 Tax=Mucilaginibacter sp. X4EP1 TaxID=2723092 RepID=UPI00216746B9|nr:LuxR C-terminal-related transcriptional regulator [Mucilaginibacter sp. X4EP1]MCS3815495.1 DNA-binding CsgD family transcriptional regulator [Mucilaginibacter sp. X4EP1]
MNILGNTQMHWLTLVFIVLELALLLFYQFLHYLSRRSDKQRIWFLLLLVLLIHYNLWNGLLPDPKHFMMPAKAQYMLTDGIAYLMGAYFPFYFYKAFNLRSLRFHATYGVTCFLLLPYGLFIAAYAYNGKLILDRLVCLTVPAIYGLLVLIEMYRAIHKKNKRNRNKRQYILETGAYLSIMPWEAMCAFAFKTPPQELRILMANIGFVALALLQITTTIRHSRSQHQRFEELLNEGKNTLFEANCIVYQLTKREIEIVLLLKKGYRYQQIADMLYISGRTVDKHIRNIYEKTAVNNKINLLNKLYGEDAESL